MTAFPLNLRTPLVSAPSLRRLLAALCVGCALLAAATRAAAVGARSARAEALLHQGQKLLDVGHYDAACEKLEASEALESNLSTLLYLGDCYDRAGRSASAWHTFLAAQAVARSNQDAAREQEASARVTALEPKLTRVLFVVPMISRVPGLNVQLGGNTIPPASWGSSIPVDAGAQQVTASAKGYRAWHATVDVPRNEAREIRINVPTLAPAAGPAPQRRSALRTAGVVTGSVGLAGIGAGAVFSALAHNSDDAAACAKSGVVQCVPGKANGPGYSNAATVSYAVGGALVATGITLFVLSPAPDNQEQHALRVAARVATGGGRLQLEGVW